MVAGEEEVGFLEPAEPDNLLRVRLLYPIYEQEWIAVGDVALDVDHGADSSTTRGARIDGGTIRAGIRALELTSRGSKC